MQKNWDPLHFSTPISGVREVAIVLVFLQVLFPVVCVFLRKDSVEKFLMFLFMELHPSVLALCPKERASVFGRNTVFVFCVYHLGFRDFLRCYSFFFQGNKIDPVMLFALEFFSSLPAASF